MPKQSPVRCSNFGTALTDLPLQRFASGMLQRDGAASDVRKLICDIHRSFTA
jgi:hypothetical protein